MTDSALNPVTIGGLDVSGNYRKAQDTVYAPPVRPVDAAGNALDFTPFKIVTAPTWTRPANATAYSAGDVMLHSVNGDDLQGSNATNGGGIMPFDVSIVPWSKFIIKEVFGKIGGDFSGLAAMPVGNPALNLYSAAPVVSPGTGNADNSPGWTAIASGSANDLGVSFGALFCTGVIKDGAKWIGGVTSGVGQPIDKTTLTNNLIYGLLQTGGAFPGISGMSISVSLVCFQSAD